MHPINIHRILKNNVSLLNQLNNGIIAYSNNHVTSALNQLDYNRCHYYIEKRKNNVLKAKCVHRVIFTSNVPSSYGVKYPLNSKDS